jgi:hypothetical protein
MCFSATGNFVGSAVLGTTGVATLRLNAPVQHHGSRNTALGYQAGVGSGGLTNATAIGANAFVSESNALVLGSGANVGIATSAPSNTFTIGQGAGHAIADGWDTYSSRRWKTNIQTLHGALAKVE